MCSKSKKRKAEEEKSHSLFARLTIASGDREVLALA
jgi:hypothetical protein